MLAVFGGLAGPRLVGKFGRTFLPHVSRGLEPRRSVLLWRVIARLFIRLETLLLISVERALSMFAPFVASATTSTTAAPAPAPAASIAVTAIFARTIFSHFTFADFDDL